MGEKLGAVSLVTVMFLLSGCASLLPQTDTTKPAAPSLDHPKSSWEAIATLHSIFDGVEPIVGGTWHAMDDSPSYPCTLPNGAEGVFQSNYRYVELQVDRKAMFDLVKEKWEKDGYKLSAREDHDAAPMLRLFATTPAGEEVQFTAADNSMTLSGESVCAPDSDSGP